jgi:hypothetical protein
MTFRKFSIYCTCGEFIGINNDGTCPKCRSSVHKRLLTKLSIEKLVKLLPIPSRITTRMKKFTPESESFTFYADDIPDSFPDKEYVFKNTLLIPIKDKKKKKEIPFEIHCYNYKNYGIAFHRIVIVNPKQRKDEWKGTTIKEFLENLYSEFFWQETYVLM